MKYLILLLTLACTSNNEVQSKILYVADHLEDCVGVSPQSCMLVKESQEQDWTFFYGEIEGFNFEKGFNYELLVEEIQVENPPADASSIRYVLKKIVSKTASVNSEDLLKEWTVVKIKGLDQLSSSPTLNFEKEESKVGGFAGCNNYFSTYTVEENALTFGNTGATRKLCEDMTAEDAFLKSLSQIARFEIIKKELYLYDINDELMILAISQ